MYPQRPYERVVNVVTVGVDDSPRLAARHPKVGAPAFFNDLMSLEGDMHWAPFSSAENAGTQLPQNSNTDQQCQKQQRKDQRTDRYTVAAPS